ncbi:MAG TPA: glycosyltransferase family 4 protein [Planctomycetes bacterium]|nr:glycosyltransferase family 4 protein [Planctomycetota bacterium]
MPTKHTNSEVAVKNSVRPVLLIDKDIVSDGASSLHHLMVGLNDDSCHTALVCPVGVETDSLVCPAVEVIRYPLFKTPLLRSQNIKALFGSVEKFKPTILHCCGNSMARLTRYLSCRLDVPYVLTFDSVRRRPFAPCVSSDHCGALIASSQVIAEHIKHSHRRLAERVIRINIGEFVEDVCACFPDTARVTSMVVAQTLDNPSDFEPLLNAVKHLAVDGCEFVLVIAGTGPAERKLHEMIKALGLSQIVTTVGNIRPVRTVFAGADIFIVPRPSRRFNPRLLEAMSVGMAVAACRGGVDDLLIEDKTAVLFDPEDELGIYSSLQKLLDKREFARRIANAAQSHIREHHSVSKMIELLIKTYRTAQAWYKNSGND